MGAHGSKEKLARSASERYVHSKYIEQERFGRFGKRARGSSARKRTSVQNGFSPSDIKIDTVITAKSDPPSAKPVSLHKRFSANNNLQAAAAAATTVSSSSSPVSEKRAAIISGKKSSSAAKHVNQTSAPVATKTSHAKEHGIQSTLSHPPTINNNNSTSINNNNHKTKSGTNSTKLATSDDHHQPLIATIHRNGKTSTAAAATAIANNKAVAVPQINVKPKVKTVQANGELNENLIEFSIVDSIDGNTAACFASTVAVPPIPGKVTRNSNQQQPKAAAAAAVDLNVIRANKTIVALSILIQHLTTDLKAFETPSLRAALETAKEKLLESQQSLETMRTKCNYLAEQIIAQENLFSTHQLTLKEASERELEKFKLSLRETEKSAQEQIQTLQYELAEINQRNAETLKTCQMKADRRCSELETQLQLSRDRELELVERLNNFTVTENQLRDKVQASEQEFSERLIAATARERELNEKLAQLMRQLKTSEDKRLELDEKLKMANDETNVLRRRRNSSEQSIPNGNASVPNQSVMLEEEVLSLRCVLDMKLNEISELRKQNQSMVQAQDELPKAQLKISVLETRLEDLTIQLKTRIEEEAELSTRNRSLQEMLNQEVKNRTRLSLHNEELQWKLKQNSEKYTTTLNELSKSYQDPSLLADFKSSLYAPISETTHENCSDTLQMGSSPPSSPVIKGVVEKCDSVSYVLELNDDLESAEAVANRVVKRAGSFRVNNFKERSPSSFKRQYSLGGANALCQSASATSLSRQHSDSPVRSIGASIRLQKTSRTRSNSLNASNEPKTTPDHHHRLPEVTQSTDYSKWQRSLKTTSTSSPLSSRSYKSNGQANGLAEVDSVNGGSIRASFTPTDDVDIDLEHEYLSTSRNDQCTTVIPAQNAVDKLKKRQHIKESAGEAMVSQQSEDDQSSGSDMDSTSASSSSAASPSHSEASNKHRHLSLDEEAFMNKIVASLSTRSTPMEVSWSEDGDNEPYAQESSA